MNIHSLLALLVICAFLGGCHRLRLDDLDASALTADAYALAHKAAERDSKHVKDVYVLPSEEWPPSMRRLNPKSVRYSYKGVWILDFKWVSKEAGIFIPALGYPWPIEGPELAPGIYKYTME